MAKSKPSDSAASKKKRQSEFYTKQRRDAQAGLARGDEDSARTLYSIDSKLAGRGGPLSPSSTPIEQERDEAWARANTGLVGQGVSRAMNMAGDPSLHGPQGMAGASVAPILARLANGARQTVAGAAGPAMQQGGQAMQGMAQRGGQAVAGAMQGAGRMAQEAGGQMGREMGQMGQDVRGMAQGAGDAMHPVVQQITSTLARMEQRMMAMEANAGQAVEGAARGVRSAAPKRAVRKTASAGPEPRGEAPGAGKTVAVGPKTTAAQEAAYRSRIAGTMKKPGVAAKPKGRSVTATERGKTVAVAQKQTGRTPAKGTVAGRVSRQTGEYTPRGGALSQKAKGARTGAPRLQAGATAGKARLAGRRVASEIDGVRGKYSGVPARGGKPQLNRGGKVVGKRAAFSGPAPKGVAKRKIVDGSPRQIATLNATAKKKITSSGKKVVSKRTAAEQASIRRATNAIANRGGRKEALANLAKPKTPRAPRKKKPT